jgi:DNA polymerase-3 subunit delta
MDSLAFLERPDSKISPLYVLYGDESFLKRQVIRALKERVLGPDAGDSAASYPGETADFAAVMDELASVPFFTPRRLVIVEDADPFVTRYRAQLEKHIDRLPSSGTLVLDVKSWPSNTRLYKLVGNSAALACKAPAAFKLPQWCVQWAASQHQKQLSNAAAALLIDLVGPDMGLLDQELLKLAIYVGDRKKIDVEDVDALVGHNREQDTWKIFDAIAAGQPNEALTMLARLFDQGEEPIRLLGAFSMQLRRLAQVARLAAQGVSLAAALDRAGVPPFAAQKAELQLRQLGRRRANRLYDWLLEVDVGLKGGSTLRPRILLEQLLVRLAQKTENEPGFKRRGTG